MPKTAQKQQATVNWSFWLGLGFFVLVMVGLFSGSWQLIQTLMQREAMPVSTLVIQGETPYTRQNEISGALQGVDMGNFFKLDDKGFHVAPPYFRGKTFVSVNLFLTFLRGGS